MTATVTLLDGTSHTFNVEAGDLEKWKRSPYIYKHVPSDDAIYIIPWGSILGIVVEGLDS